MKKKLLSLLIIILLLCSCSKEKLENPIVKMDIKDYGEITIELYPDIAYNTVANFVNLIEDGFYDNNNFHRLAKGFVLQGGDPTATGTGGPGYSIKGEFNQNGYRNTLAHTEGVISMARSQDYNSAGSQFFIVLSDAARNSLDGKYAGFGKVIEGMDIIHQIENADLKFTDEESEILKKPLTINKVTIDTKNHNYQVKKIK